MVPFLDLKAQHAPLRAELEAAAGRVLASGRFVLGPEVAGFEREFADFVGTAYAVALNTGTSALHLALLALGIGPGDEVITVPSTFVATVAAIVYTGARPVFVDIDPATCTLDAARLSAAVTGRTKAILPVHLYGRMADMDAILEFARSKGIAIVEDACQAHGADTDGRNAGSLGDIGCFSFYPSKNLGACGEGGAVVTSKREIAERIRQLRDWGQEGKYHHVRKGFNYRMDELQAAVLRLKLPRLQGWNEARRRHAELYERLLAGGPVSPPQAAKSGCHVYHVYAVRSTLRDRLRRQLQECGIETGIHYPEPVHMMPAYSDLGYSKGDYPNAEQLAQEELSLPMYPELTEAQIREVCRAVNTFGAEQPALGSHADTPPVVSTKGEARG